MSGGEANVDVRELLMARDALLEGHFLLASGLHSDRYVQCALLLQHPADAETLAREIAARWSDTEVDSICGPALGGMVIGYELARAMGTRGFFTERKEGVMQLRRGFTITPGERILIAEDVVTTGGSAQETRELLESHGGKVVGFTSLVNRGAHRDLNVPFRALLDVQAAIWKPEECPLCAKGEQVVKPGGAKRAGG